MPKLIPTSAHAMIVNSKKTEDQDDVLSQRSHSNETLSLNEDPMNLVETSWDISSSLKTGSIPIKN